MPMAVFVLLLILAGALLWYLLFMDTAAARRPVADTPMLMLPPPPPPEPEPEPEPEPTPEPETVEPMPAPEPLDEQLKPVEEEAEAPTPDASDPVTMDTEAQAGNDSFGIQKGGGGGSIGAGSAGGAGNASYGRYLAYVLKQAISRDERARKHAYQLQVDVWIEPDGVISRVELARGSGNREADESVIEALRAYGRIEERPPRSLPMPARVLVQGRRPAG